MDRDTEVLARSCSPKERCDGMKKPEKLLIVYDGETAWQEQSLTTVDKIHAIVTKMKATGLKKGSSVLAALLGDKNC